MEDPMLKLPCVQRARAQSIHGTLEHRTLAPGAHSAHALTLHCLRRLETSSPRHPRRCCLQYLLCVSHAPVSRAYHARMLTRTRTRMHTHACGEEEGTSPS